MRRAAAPWRRSARGTPCIAAAALLLLQPSEAPSEGMTLRLERNLASPGPAAPAAAYVDRLIEGSVDSEPSVVAAADRTPGRRLFSAGYRVEFRQPAGGGHGFEHGLDAQYRFETLNYGEFFIDAAARHAERARGESLAGHGQSARLTIYQHGFPLTGALVADSAVGAVRTPPSSLFNQSYRIFLPTTLLAGASTVVSAGGTEARAFAGESARFEGAFSQGFALTAGRVAGVSIAQRFGPALSAGAHWVGVRGAAEVPDHDSATLALEYAPDSRRRLKVQMLGSGGGKLGAWLDADWSTDPWRQRFGAYRLDPGIGWADTAILNDQQGLYWRTDRASLRETTSLGADATRANIDGDASRPGLDSVALYATHSLRIDRTLSAGGGATVQRARARSPLSRGASSISLNGYGSLLTAWGVSRLDISGHVGRPDLGPRDDTVALTLGQDWSLPGRVAGSGVLTYARDHSSGRERKRASCGLTVRGPGIGSLSWDASAVFARASSDAGRERNVNLNASLFWPIGRNWTAQAQFARNAIDPGPAAAGAAPLPFQKDQRLQLGIRHDFSAGVPYASTGMSGGRGSGGLSGVVFFDENGDGEKQPTERGAAGVVVYLDGRYPATTDSEGRFSYPAVPAGTHSLRVLAERLPLPWALEDDAPRVVSVPLRGEATAAIGLTRLRP